MAKHLILGGARSGKSALAHRLAEASSLPVSFIATALAGDSEMSARIHRHRDGRPSDWRTVEEPLDLASALDGESHPERCVVIDCLTLWLTNCLLENRLTSSDRRVTAFLSSLANAQGEIVLVSNEVGLGLVPDFPLGRRFRDEQGRLNQAVGAACDEVTLVVAGLPWPLKSR